jgi:hypothetical protein
MFDTIYDLLRPMGFVYMECEDLVRNPHDGSVLQCDSIFVRESTRGAVRQSLGGRNFERAGSDDAGSFRGVNEVAGLPTEDTVLHCELGIASQQIRWRTWELKAIHNL